MEENRKYEKERVKESGERMETSGNKGKKKSSE